MKGNRNTGKAITAIWLAAIMVASVWLIVMPSAASADDYHMYGDWNLGGEHWGRILIINYRKSR